MTSLLEGFGSLGSGMMRSFIVVLHRSHIAWAALSASGIWFYAFGPLDRGMLYAKIAIDFEGRVDLGQPGLAASVVIYELTNKPVHDQEGEMLMRKGLLSSGRRSVVLAAIAVMVLTTAEPPLAIAGQVAPASKGVSATTASSDATDFSSVRRRRYYRGGGSAAGLAFMGMAIGTIGAIAAQQQRNDYYNNYGYYGYGPGYYGGGPYYYGGGPYYSRRYYNRPY